MTGEQILAPSDWHLLDFTNCTKGRRVGHPSTVWNDDEKANDES